MTGIWLEGRNPLSANGAGKESRASCTPFANPYVLIKLLVDRDRVTDDLSRSNELLNAFLDSLRFQLELL